VHWVCALLVPSNESVPDVSTVQRTQTRMLKLEEIAKDEQITGLDPDA